MLKNKEGKTPRLLAKDNEHKDALKECRKAEKQTAKLAKGGSRTGEPYAIRVSLYLTLIYMYMYLPVLLGHLLEIARISKNLYTTTTPYYIPTDGPILLSPSKTAFFLANFPPSLEDENKERSSNVVLQVNC